MTKLMETRGRDRASAAAYIGVGETKFDEMVTDGRMPEPRKIDKRLVWDVRELDSAFERLPRRGAFVEAASTGWDRMVA